MIFCLVRTSNDGKPQQGITFLLIDMQSSGVSVRPIRTLDGGEEINDVFLDDVRVPQANRIGEENKGWTYAKFLLGLERTGIAAIGRSKQELRRLKEIAAAEPSGAGSLAEDGQFTDKMADLEIDILALESLVLRIVADEAAGRKAGAEASILKIKGTEIQQRLSELALEAIGYYANPYIAEAGEAGWNEAPVGPEHAATIAPHYFNWRKASIYGGTNEIQKNIIAKMVLGL
jgi:alkylation response protein AidB-like acyl-CoA dehydrogenase